jgi:hypothetical protein
MIQVWTDEPQSAPFGTRLDGSKRAGASSRLQELRLLRHARLTKIRAVLSKKFKIIFSPP